MISKSLVAASRSRAPPPAGRASERYQYNHATSSNAVMSPEMSGLAANELSSRRTSSPMTSAGSPVSWNRSRRARNRSSARSEEHTSELQSHVNLVCRLLLEKKKKNILLTLHSTKKKKNQRI